MGNGCNTVYTKKEKCLIFAYIWTQLQRTFLILFITCILKANLQWQNIWNNKLFFSRKNKLLSQGHIYLIHILKWSLLLQLFKPNGFVWVYKFSDVQSLAMGRQKHAHSQGRDGKKREHWAVVLSILRCWAQGPPAADSCGGNQYPLYPVSQLYSSWGTSGVPVTESSASGWFWDHLGSSKLQKQMPKIPNLLLEIMFS